MRTLYTLLILLFPFFGISQTVYVTNTNNEGPGSFRDAVENASNGTTVRFDNSLVGQTIIISDFNIQINSDITIKGIIQNNQYVTLEFADVGIWYYNSITIDSLRMDGGSEYNLGNYFKEDGDITLLNSKFENFTNSYILYAELEVSGILNKRILIDNCIFNNNNSITFNGVTFNGFDTFVDSIIITNSQINDTYDNVGLNSNNFICGGVFIMQNCELSNSTLAVSANQANIFNSILNDGLSTTSNELFLINSEVQNSINLTAENLIYIDNILMQNFTSLYLTSDQISINNSNISSEDNNLGNLSTFYSNELYFYNNIFSNLNISNYEPFNTTNNNQTSIIDSCRLNNTTFYSNNIENLYFNYSDFEYDINSNSYIIEVSYISDFVISNSTIDFTSIGDNSNMLSYYPNVNSSLTIYNSTLNSPRIMTYSSGLQESNLNVYNSTLNGTISFIQSENLTMNLYSSIINKLNDFYFGFVGSEEFLSNINVISDGNNLIGDLSIQTESFIESDILNVENTDLNPLDYYGGFTRTMPPNDCSPALDAGDPQSTDISQNQLSPIGVKDIGAAESNIEIVRYNCENGNCITVNNSSGEFCTLNECQLNCEALETFNCVNDACVDPMDGSGEFSTLNDCEQVCQNISSISENLIDVNIYPNPSSNIFNIEFNSDSETEISVTNVLGEQVYFESTKSIGEFNTQIDLSNYSKGIYNLTIKTSDGLSNHKLILQ
jgi:hypothetical protein